MLFTPRVMTERHKIAAAVLAPLYTAEADEIDILASIFHRMTSSDDPMVSSDADHFTMFANLIAKFRRMIAYGRRPLPFEVEDVLTADGIFNGFRSFLGKVFEPGTTNFREGEEKGLLRVDSLLDLRKAILTKLEWQKQLPRKVCANGALFMLARFEGTQFDAVRAMGTRFLKCNLSGVMIPDSDPRNCLGHAEFSANTVLSGAQIFAPMTSSRFCGTQVTEGTVLGGVEVVAGRDLAIGASGTLNIMSLSAPVPTVLSTIRVV